MKYSEIVFDIDGTLLNTEYSVLQGLQDTLQTLTGRLYPLEELMFSLGIPGLDTLDQLSIPDPVESLKLWNINIKKYEHTVQVYEGIPELVAAVRKAGCGLGIVTSQSYAEYASGFAAYPLSQYFTTVIRADDTTGHKPDPDPLLKYMSLTGAAPEQVLYIGDSIYDMKCAESSGADFALAGWGTHLTSAPYASYRPETPADLAKLLFGQE